MTERFPVPKPPEKAPPYRFPLVATIAPVAGALAIWLLTSSPFALVFAALGPLTAVASVVDSRLGARRTARREKRRFDAEFDDARARIRSLHAAESAELRERTPSAGSIARRSGADPYRWRATAGSPVLVVLGSGDVPSALDVSAGDDPALAELARLASTIESGPVTVDARLGIGVCGPSPARDALARALVVQLAWHLSPAAFRITTAPGSWMDSLPHATDRRAIPEGIVAQFATRDGAATTTIATAPLAAGLPGGCAVVVTVSEGTAAVVQHPTPGERRSFEPAVISQEAASNWALALAADANREGLAPTHAALPPTVELADLLGASGEPPGLECRIGRTAIGDLTVDLVDHGPHAIVGGTTGSGKSELLVSWVLAMAAAHPPDRVSFLLVDFKGGSAFAPLAGLVHTVGTITDLDGHGAVRALRSLRAEIRFRERALASAGVRDIAQLPGLPRLVIVVDEFAAMLQDQPDLHTLFADLAARGRSLGIHLVLCTQRPAGVVRDSVLANADLRISLRVNNRADSAAVIGADSAAELDPTDRGRGYVVRGGAEPVAAQFAIASGADIAAVSAHYAGSPPARRPWCDPLPPVVDDAPPGVFALVDLPDEQRRDWARWNRVHDGSVLVVGAPRSGKSSAVAALAGESPLVVPAALDRAWDRLAEAEGERDRVVVVDDLDSLLARAPGDYRQAMLDRLAALLRDGPARGVHLVLSAQRVTGELSTVAALAPARLLLAQSNRQEFLLAGGESAAFLPGLPPGGGVWRGDRVQVVLAEPVADPTVPPRSVAVPDGPLAIVSGRAAALAAMIASIGIEALDPATMSADTVVIGDAEEWQSRWGAFGIARQRAGILFDRCSPADFRVLTRSRELPPLLDASGDYAWLLTPEGNAVRARLGEWMLRRAPSPNPPWADRGPRPPAG